MHAFKVSDGFPQLQKMGKGNKLHIFLFIKNLTKFFNLKLNAIMFGCGVNLLILNMLAIQTNVRFPKHLAKLSYITYRPAIMFSQVIKFGGM
jgi:hypothetical protein